MSVRRCELCTVDLDNSDFGEHMDGHTDAEFERWPGGLPALGAALDASLVEAMAAMRAKGLLR